MKHKILFTSVLAVAMLFISCAPALQVTTDYDKSANFTQYKTFALAKLEARNISISQLNADRITNAIKAEMIKKGFAEVATNPDLLIYPVTILQDKKQVSASTDYYGYGGYYRPYGWGGTSTAYTTYNVYNYTDGSLIIDIADAKTEKLLWEGIGNKEIDTPSKDLDTKIPAAVAKIMAAFPPGAATEK